MTTRNIEGFAVPFLPARRTFANVWTEYEPNKRVILPKEYAYIGVPATKTSGLEKFEAPDPADWCPRGYAVIQADARGTFNSEGDMHQFGSQEAHDGYDLIEWTAKQPWCNENVATVGNSWLGIMQWFIAAEKPPHLKAIAPWEGAGDFYRQTLCRGGIPNPLFWGHGFYEDVASMIEAYPHMNAYWEDKNPDITKIDVPMYACMSYSTGLHTEGSFRGWKYASSKDKWLRIHGTQEWHDLYKPENNDDLQRFLDRYLLNKENGWENTPKVRLSLLRFGDRLPIVERPEDDYPPARTQYHTMYLDAGKRSLSYSTPEQATSASYIADQWEDQGVQFTYTFDKYTELVGPSKVKLFMSTNDNDDMDVYVIIRKLDRDGNALLTLNVPLDQQPHGTRFEDVDDLNLYKHNGPSGRLRASKRALGQDPKLSEEQRERQLPTELWLPYDKEEKVPRGEVVELDIPIWPAGIVFESGESMRLEIKGHDHPLHEWPNLGPLLKNLNVGNHTVHASKEYPSHIVLPLIF
ncbi:Alpha/Beta hydrolase protein [Boeremia exigua]|uniref:Alpha/Beta hydrolase protein n=1 Tax=Boeremia exigua TaxID=749465 RepID=UPI001E8E721B|nr:Alpha/Beta hydrolase protein [Boeremia exigua]KAH6629745.1 Alpha/Beta hydrolase protein [Boeremia exigua]